MAKSFKPKQNNPPAKKLGILDVGAGFGLAKAVYPNDDITTLDAPGTGANIETNLESQEFLDMELPQFDLVMCSHVVEHIAPRTVDPVLAKLYAATVDGGQIIVKVPSIEWAAEQIASEKATIAVLFHLWGGQNGPYDVHKWGYTIGGLRNVVKRAGYVIAKAGVGHYEIIVNGKAYPAQETYVIGIKVEDNNNGKIRNPGTV